MNIEQLRLEMIKHYSTAIDLFSNNKYSNAYLEMVNASKLALEISRQSITIPDIREYKGLAEHYMDKAKEYLSYEDNDHHLKHISTKDMPTHGFSDFIGYDNVKDYLTDNVIKYWKSHTLKDRNKNGILFYGPHGVAKTRFAHALIKELNAKAYYFQPLKHFKISDFSTIEYEYTNLFKEAEKEDNVIFFIESPLPFFSNGKDDLSIDVTNLFIKLFKKELKRIRRKNLNILFIATTSTPDKLNKQIYQDIFDDIIEIPCLDEETRLKVINFYLKDEDVSSEDINKILNFTKDTVTTDITRLCNAVIENKESKTLEEILNSFVKEDISEYHKNMANFTFNNIIV